jgi:hypothetical protein
MPRRRTHCRCVDDAVDVVITKREIQTFQAATGAFHGSFGGLTTLRAAVLQHSLYALAV